ncbi:class I SAM-dependent methyltransferase [Desulfovibrio oxyclinae]|uniref:class I SAM-dependent methyltransferase n=1 Tax=Desulfovibrio oxyclinae TaxID=63560 RepID=UPI000380A213|nr:class I SAM-dependent methyltransferase [Desulfovibrio oxyclinae]
MDEYARFAGIYDWVVGRPLGSVFRKLILTLPQGGGLLDVCCGTGMFAAMARERGFSVCGLDRSAPMLAVARRKRPGLPLVRADASAMPFGGEQFHLATVTFALHEKPQFVREAILAEILRVLRPGGTILLADYCHPHGASRPAAAAAGLVERLAGAEHHRNYADWMRRGAAEGFLDDSGLNWERLAYGLSGVAGIYRVRQPD